MGSTNQLSAPPLPVVIHMWFEDGDDWAFHPSFQGKLGDVVEKLDPILKASDKAAESQTFEIPFEGGHLIGERVADPSCRDPRAVKRNPFIVRAALLQDFSTEEAFAVRRHLSSITPRMPGKSDSLRISLEDDWTPPVVEEDERRDPELQVVVLRAGEASGGRDELISQNTQLSISRKEIEQEAARAALALRSARTSLVICASVAGVGLLLSLGLAVRYVNNSPAMLQMLIGLVVAVAVAMTSLLGLSSSAPKPVGPRAPVDPPQSPTAPPRQPTGEHRKDARSEE